MAAITAGGIGSGLDVNGIVEKLMEIERKPLATFDAKLAAAVCSPARLLFRML